MEEIADLTTKRKRAVHFEAETLQILNDSNLTSDCNMGSPNKRVCLREVENGVKPDTPAIAGVKSRLKALGALYANRDENSDSLMEPPCVPIPYTEVEQVIDSDHVKSNRLRSGRLAALAQTVSSWDDEPGYHVTHNKPEFNVEVEMSKDVVQSVQSSSPEVTPPEVADSKSSGCQPVPTVMKEITSTDEIKSPTVDVIPSSPTGSVESPSENFLTRSAVKRASRNPSGAKDANNSIGSIQVSSAGVRKTGEDDKITTSAVKKARRQSSGAGKNKPSPIVGSFQMSPVSSGSAEPQSDEFLTRSAVKKASRKPSGAEKVTPNPGIRIARSSKEVESKSDEVLSRSVMKKASRKPSGATKQAQSPALRISPRTSGAKPKKKKVPTATLR